MCQGRAAKRGRHKNTHLDNVDPFLHGADGRAFVGLNRGVGMDPNDQVHVGRDALALLQVVDVPGVEEVRAHVRVHAQRPSGDGAVRRDVDERLELLAVQHRHGVELGTKAHVAVPGSVDYGWVTGTILVTSGSLRKHATQQ